MKNKVKKIYIQTTDGSIFCCKFLKFYTRKTSFLKLATDCKSHRLWRGCSAQIDWKQSPGKLGSEGHEGRGVVTILDFTPVGQRRITSTAAL